MASSKDPALRRKAVNLSLLCTESVNFRAPTRWDGHGSVPWELETTATVARRTRLVQSKLVYLGGGSSASGIGQTGAVTAASLSTVTE